ncbi:hypothetical protein BGZ46_010381 [Entomortierella lignicola]|nr:hypothetical protein BGZ46_010381 [Entomortierella lignicola]
MATTTSTPTIDQDLALAIYLDDLEHQGFSLDHEHYYPEESEDYHQNYKIEDDLEYDHKFGDIHLALPVQHKPKSKRSKNKKKEKTQSNPLFTKIVQPIVDCPRPLVFPLEVLGLVCLHLSQSTLRTCVSLVCKNWNAVSDQYIRRAGVWVAQSEDYQTQLLEQMKRLDTLECWFNMDPDIPSASVYSPISNSETRRFWNAFRETVLRPFNTDSKLVGEDFKKSNHSMVHNNQRMEQQHKDRPSCLLHNIRYLSIRGKFIEFADAITTLHQRQGFKFLRTFFLDIHSGTRDFIFFPFLDDCPNLVEFTLQVAGCDVSILTGDEDDLIPDDIPQPVNPETAHFPVKPKVIIPPRSYQQRYNLKVFDVASCFIKQPVLERVVSTCPKLRVFKARDINKDRWRVGTGYYRHNIDQDRLIKHAKAMCPDLEWYHVAPRKDTDLDLPRIIQAKTYFPETKYLTLSLAGYQPSIYYNEIAAERFNRITVLEVTNPYPQNSSSTILHNVLCRTPNLLHLIAPKYQFLITHISNTGRSIGLSNISIGSGNWKCRDLRTFNMQFTTGMMAFTVYIERNRLFGNLTDLTIAGTHLYIGQLIKHPHAGKQRAKTPVKPKVITQNQQQHQDQDQQNRYENIFLRLRGLRSLEHLHVTAQQAIGVIKSSDFEFLRKHSDETIVRVIPNENIDVDKHFDNKLSPEDTSCEGKVVNETFWPQLQSFHIRYYDSTCKQGYEWIVADVKGIRPGIEFSMKKRFMVL